MCEDVEKQLNDKIKHLEETINQNCCQKKEQEQKFEDLTNKIDELNNRE